MAAFERDVYISNVYFFMIKALITTSLYRRGLLL